MPLPVKSQPPFLGPLSHWLEPQLQPERSYPCPICRHGQVQQMLMMEAWACNFCRHILSQEGSQPILRLEDSNLNDCRWRWQGQSWQAVHPGGGEVTAAVWGIAVTLTILPAGLLWLTYHTFPPLPGSSWLFPALWMGLTIAAHVGIVLWILLNHYQVSPYLNWQWRRGRYRLGHWWARHFSRWRRLQ